jgi:hypothetical protein
VIALVVGVEEFWVTLIQPQRAFRVRIVYRELLWELAEESPPRLFTWSCQVQAGSVSEAEACALRSFGAAVAVSGSPYVPHVLRADVHLLEEPP